MIVRPETTIRIAHDEPITLEYAAADNARLTPRRAGEARRVKLEGHSFAYPGLDAQPPLIFADPDIVILEWLSGDTVLAENRLEIVSRHYFTLDDLKNYGDGRDEFAGIDDDKLRMCRQAATEVFEVNARRSFVQRIGRTKDYGRSDLVYLNHGDVSEILTDGYVPVSDVQLERTPDNRGPYPRFVEYVYGLETVPAAVSEAVLMLAAYTLRPTNRPIGASGESSDAGYIHFTIAGRDGATAIPEVNAVIEQFGRGPGYVY